MNKFAILIAAGIVSAAIPVSAQTGSTAPAKPKSSTAQKSTAAKTSASTAKSYDRALLHPALLKDKAPETYQVKFETSKGDFTVSVTRAWAPLGADRFYNLAKHHFFDNGSFFRVLKGFVAQFGISAYPPVSAVWEKATIKDDSVTQSNKKYSLTFATAGPNTRTTQLFINLADNPRLDGMGFAPFGQVTEGMSVVDNLYADYGEGAPGGSGPNQDEIQKQGKPYLDKNFPNLDFVKTTTLTPAPSPATHRTLPAKKTVPAPKP
ncbi:MAG TPA: peptidylprolyl isomerase [Candidatus Acidoferrum sp.]|jgi:peptidyl-prolyl cis-trans isomerase A (cyclophilin A)|nr:peptidylprolyl isomerase [Candidatus Acidoferrum sp.]